MTDTLLQRGYSAEAIAERSRAAGEPEWMLEFRQKAWRFFEEIPWPDGTQETWRRTRLTGFSLDDFAPLPAGAESQTLPEEVQASIAEVTSEASLALLNGRNQRVDLPENLAAKGVIFTDLPDALKRYPELVRKHFGSAVGIDENKFSALHYALWNGGLFLYVPRNVQIAIPLQAAMWQQEGAYAGYNHTLVVADEGSQVTLVEDQLGAGDGMMDNVVELLPQPGSQVHYLQTQNLATTTWNFSTQRLLLTRDCLLRYFIGSWGSRLSKVWINMELNGQGSHGELLGLYFPSGRQHLDHHTNQWHTAPNASSDLLFKGALKDRARSVYQGFIKVFPGAQKTNAYQANRNLLLSKHARADSIPGLEIEADDVRCTHGATASQLQEDYVFYLMARGINRSNAERLVVQGFLEEVAHRIPVEGVRSKLEAEIARKIGL
jgi:Fe-S cluster assembly protein SufD